MLNKILSFFSVAAYAVALIGGVGYACFSHAYVIAVAIIALAAMAFPTLKKFWLNLIN